MLNIKDALSIIHKNIPNGAVHLAAKYKDEYIFSVYYNDAIEGMMDPYYAVNSKTGKFKELAVGKDATPLELVLAFRDNAIKIK